MEITIKDQARQISEFVAEISKRDKNDARRYKKDAEKDELVAALRKKMAEMERRLRYYENPNSPPSADSL